jgi:hypothetical protein
MLLHHHWCRSSMEYCLTGPSQNLKNLESVGLFADIFMNKLVKDSFKSQMTASWSLYLDRCNNWIPLDLCSCLSKCMCMYCYCRRAPTVSAYCISIKLFLSLHLRIWPLICCMNVRCPKNRAAISVNRCLLFTVGCSDLEPNTTINTGVTFLSPDTNNPVPRKCRRRTSIVES